MDILNLHVYTTYVLEKGTTEHEKLKCVCWNIYPDKLLLMQIQVLYMLHEWLI